MICELPGGVAVALSRQSQLGVNGSLLVAGDPGGAVHLEGGRVVGVESPGAPSVEGLLLRSGRVLETSWVAAQQAGAAHGDIAFELVRRGLVGAVELQAVCLLALYDATYAIAAGEVEQCAWAPGGPPPRCWTRTVTAVDAEVLRMEAERRLAAFARSSAPLSPGRDRLSAVDYGQPQVRRPDGLRADILRLADGRRTARDIAFQVGRGVYPVMVEAVRLLAQGMLRIEPPAQEHSGVRALLAPRRSAPNAPAPDGPLRLPRRHARASGT